ncbi:hypothetical protein HF086_004597 [Spodoptera exigua]|uniref:Uncharacterized protein n=1 Tax=Spodoptera exigua TaxID=7107 RepID=A0A922SKK2_SPOEX|nr:hypothetical protein HF086_004597 [Spodoptera exigua]
MGSLGFWSMLAIFYQTLICVIISWLTLDCKFEPNSTELHEMTLMKLLYLYDPEACERIYFYNVTARISHERMYTSVVWPTKNHIASRFRTEIQVWMSLHLLWMLFAVINMTQGQRSCSFYATLLPFTITGIALLITDVIYAILFLIDARYTYTELGDTFSEELEDTLNESYSDTSDITYVPSEYENAESNESGESEHEERAVRLRKKPDRYGYSNMCAVPDVKAWDDAGDLTLQEALDMPADILTKSLPSVKHHKFVEMLAAILLYLTNNGHLRAIMKKPLAPAQDVEDTSWIAVSMAYCSMRGIVQWLLNFWIVKDNYFEGLEHYRSLEYIKPRMRRKSSSLNL